MCIYIDLLTISISLVDPWENKKDDDDDDCIYPNTG
jgi:hypothetical protein